MLELNGSKKLVLEFDEMTALAGQYRVRFTHHNKNWEPSGLPDQWFIEGINELILQNGVMNGLSEPKYVHYSMEVPGSRMKFLASGNYLLHVYDFQSDYELFSLPFFVTEEIGDLAVNIETVYNIGPGGAAVDQPFGVFVYPEFVDFPLFDLSYSFIQNRFWKKARTPAQISVANEGRAEFHLSRPNSFAANFELTGLDLTSISAKSPKVYAYQPGYTPPRIILRDDYLNFTATGGLVNMSENGAPNDDRFARYAEVFFRFNTSGTFNDARDVFLVGDFNQWSISDRYRLRYNPEVGVLETSALIKEGRYDYKYVRYSNDRLDELTFSDSITKKVQEYITFVYYRDPKDMYDRILRYSLLYSR